MRRTAHCGHWDLLNYFSYEGPIELISSLKVFVGIYCFVVFYEGPHWVEWLLRYQKLKWLQGFIWAVFLLFILFSIDPFR